MSDTSIHLKDQGYTSPDFLTNLFRKPLYSSISLSSFETNSHASRDIYSTKQNDLPPLSFQKRSSSPLKFKNTSSILNKYCKSTPTIDQQKISNSKYKIFFKTLFHGTMEDQEINVLWNRLQQSLKNPFAFDKFIDQLKQKKDKENQNKKITQVVNQKIIKDKIISKTPSKRCHQIQKIRQKSVQKGQKSKNLNKNDEEKQKKVRLKNIMLDIRQQLLANQRFIRQK